MALIYHILVLLFLLFHKLRIKQTARFGNPFGLQTSLVFYGLVLQRTLFSAANLLVHIPQDDIQHLPRGHDIRFFWEVADIAGDKVRIL